MLYPNGTTTRPAVSSPFGPRSGGAFSFHYGADLVGFSTIRAVGAGTVTFSGWLNNSAGNTIVIDHGDGVSSVYMHNASHAVSRGQRVAEGHPIALMGATGNATGPCNHLEIRIHGTSVEPLAYIAARLTQPKPATQQEEEMPITIIERNNSQLSKSLYDVRTGRAIRTISRDENVAFRRAAPGAVVYITLSDAEYRERGGQ